MGRRLGFRGGVKVRRVGVLKLANGGVEGRRLRCSRRELGAGRVITNGGRLTRGMLVKGWARGRASLRKSCFGQFWRRKVCERVGGTLGDSEICELREGPVEVFLGIEGLVAFGVGRS